LGQLVHGEPERKEGRTSIKHHTLYESSRIPGRVALDAPDGYTISSGQRFRLKLGKYWLNGHAEGVGNTCWFIPDGGNYRQDRIALPAGMTIREEESGQRCPSLEN